MKKEKLLLCLKLFTSFLKTGAFTFGGGYAMLPLIERETSEKNKWVSQKDILDIVAVAESTPGPIAINAATFVGFRTAGFFGALSATLGVVLPSFVIIYIISVFFQRFSEITVIKYAFFGIRAGVLSLVLSALIKFFKQLPKNAFSYIIAALCFLAVALFNVNVLIVIISGGIAGLALTLGGKQNDNS